MPHGQVLGPLQAGSEPALQEDDLAHHVLVQGVLQVLPLQLLEVDLRAERVYGHVQ